MTHTFDSGSFALELLLTGGPPPWDRYEILHTPEDLAAWLPDSHLALELPFSEEQVRISRVELDRVKEFRAAIWRVIPALTATKPVPGIPPADVDAKDLELINQMVGPLPTVRLSAVGRREWETPITGSQVLGAAARELVDLLGRKPERLRMCAGDNCALMFYDTSRPGNRRWCSMQRCGNRNKVGSYRTRRHDDS
ncbi:CGNR zinc finger domain-containing protein [Kribbella sancticallisti]|uniref:CGNR zinc finger domain-containing protein n=1 Tax=Kribbella sancticallisti TaxID=460087 RepID=A0ABP4QMF9_9ACTN